MKHHVDTLAASLGRSLAHDERFGSKVDGHLVFVLYLSDERLHWLCHDFHVTIAVTAGTV